MTKNKNTIETIVREDLTEYKKSFGEQKMSTNDMFWYLIKSMDDLKASVSNVDTKVDNYLIKYKDEIKDLNDKFNEDLDCINDKIATTNTENNSKFVNWTVFAIFLSILITVLGALFVLFLKNLGVVF